MKQQYKLKKGFYHEKVYIKIDLNVFINQPAPLQLWREAFQNRAERSLIIDYPETTESQALIKQYLMNGYVFAMAIDSNGLAYHTISSNPYSTLDDTEVGKIICSSSTGGIADHAMTLVGYNDDIWLDRNNNGIVDANELGAYKIANSWGVEYANDGFVWLSYAYASAMLSYVETYIFSKDKHMPKLLAEFEIEVKDPSGFYGRIRVGTVWQYRQDRI